MAEVETAAGLGAKAPSGLVNFVLGDGQVRPAVIVRAFTEKLVNLHVLLDGDNDLPHTPYSLRTASSEVPTSARLGALDTVREDEHSRFVAPVAELGGTRTARATSVEYDAAKAPGTWHWPLDGELAMAVAELRAPEPQNVVVHVHVAGALIDADRLTRIIADAVRAGTR